MANTRSTDLSNATWRKSSRSTAQGANCVEVAGWGTGRALRDSKSPDTGMLLVDVPSFRALAVRIKGGRFDV